MKKDDLLYFLHIRDSITKVLEYSSGIEEEDFLKNTMLQDALVRQIEIIGEASNKISANSRKNIQIYPGNKLLQ